ncbi:unnamed protein product [Closterium sp. NIES-64]|nr:unnamed protein product [Closterium sp. NIES-64]
MQVTCDGLSTLFHGCRKLRDLRVLTLHRLPHLPPNVTLLSDLRTLHLCRHTRFYSEDHLENLIASPERIGALQQLQELRVAAGSAFQGLPDSIGSLTNLRSLTFTNPSLSHLPTSIGRLPHLQTLEIEMEKLEWIPDSFQHLTHLRSLSLHSKCLTRGVPEHVMGAMLRLKALSLSCPEIDSLPDNLGALIQLETLKLENLPYLRCLPESMGELQRLRLLEIDQVGLRQLPESLCTGSMRHSLEKLYLRECIELKQLPPQLPMLTRLQDLEITFCQSVESLDPLLAPDPALGVTASFAAAPDIAPRPPLDPAPASATVAPTATAAGPSAGSEVNTLPRSLGQLQNLRVLKLQHMDKLSVLPESLGQLKHLETLELCFLPELNSLPKSLHQLPKLKEPFLLEVGRVTKWWWIDYLPSVRSAKMRLMIHWKRTCSPRSSQHCMLNHRFIVSPDQSDSLVVVLAPDVLY